MKNVIYGILVLGLVGLGFVGCQKEEVNKSQEKPEATDNKTSFPKKAGEAGKVKEKSRAYVWVNDKLDCSQDGSGCIVSSKYITGNEEIDLSAIQVLTLIELRNTNLNLYFSNNNLSYEFPSLYESDVKNKIEASDVLVNFEFPYLKLTNKKGDLVKVFNYETTLSNDKVIQALKAGGSYTKKASLSTSSGSVWKCTEDGDNCKVSSVKYNAEWLADNPKFLFAPTTENIEKSQIVHDNTVKRVIVRTDSGKYFGIEF